MTKSPRVRSWVVYMTPLVGKPGGLRAVCSQAEWDEMEAARPGFRTLVQAGIRSEGEAERLARGTSGDPVPRGDRAPARTAEVAPEVAVTPSTS